MSGITVEQIEFFRDNGYLHCPGMIAGDDLARLTVEVQAFVNNERETFFRSDLGGDSSVELGQENFLQICGLWRTSGIVRELALDSIRGGCAGALLDTDRVHLLSDMILVKPGNFSRATHWHQDFVDHSTSIPEVTMWVSLDTATEASGCMRYVPGSYKWGKLIGYDYGDGTNYEKQGVDVSTAVTIEAAPGDAIFHHGLCVHGAGPNRTPDARRAYIIRYAHADTVYERNEPVYPTAEDVTGQHLNEQDHPVVWEAKQ